MLLMTTPNSKGFSLIEILIAMAILAILTAVAVPSYQGYVKSAKMTEAKNNLAALRLAEEEHYLEYNSYFTGDDYNEVESNSKGLWERTAGEDGFHFDYAVTTSSGWTATATGNKGVVNGETVTIRK